MIQKFYLICRMKRKGKGWRMIDYNIIDEVRKLRRGLSFGGGSAKKTISWGRPLKTVTATFFFFFFIFLFFFFFRILHFHQHLVEDVHVAGKSQRTLARVPILGFCFFQKHLEQRVISVLCLYEEPLHFGSNVDGETTLWCHINTVTAIVFLPSFPTRPWFAPPHHHHAAFSSCSYPLPSLPRFRDEPLHHLLLRHITHLRIHSNTTLNI